MAGNSGSAITIMETISKPLDEKIDGKFAEYNEYLQKEALPRVIEEYQGEQGVIAAKNYDLNGGSGQCMMNCCNGMMRGPDGQPVMCGTRMTSDANGNEIPVFKEPYEPKGEPSAALLKLMDLREKHGMGPEQVEDFRKVDMHLKEVFDEKTLAGQAFGKKLEDMYEDGIMKGKTRPDQEEDPQFKFESKKDDLLSERRLGVEAMVPRSEKVHLEAEIAKIYKSDFTDRVQEYRQTFSGNSDVDRKNLMLQIADAAKNARGKIDAMLVDYRNSAYGKSSFQEYRNYAQKMITEHLNNKRYTSEDLKRDLEKAEENYQKSITQKFEERVKTGHSDIDEQLTTGKDQVFSPDWMMKYSGGGQQHEAGPSGSGSGQDDHETTGGLSSEKIHGLYGGGHGRFAGNSMVDQQFRSGGSGKGHAADDHSQFSGGSGSKSVPDDHAFHGTGTGKHAMW